ncbi:unnamed protein product, partial [Laminaria digitata]
MGNPGDPEYMLTESTEGLLFSLCQTGPSTSRSLSASRANRRSAAYGASSPCAGKSRLKTHPPPSSATTLLAAADAWNKPYPT